MLKRKIKMPYNFMDNSRVAESELQRIRVGFLGILGV